MSHIEISVDPIIFQAGPFALRWYSLAIMAGIIVVIVPARREFIRRGMPRRGLDTIAFFTVLGGIISFMRQEQVWCWGLREARVAAIVVLAVATAGLAWLLGRGPDPVTPAAGS